MKRTRSMADLIDCAFFEDASRSYPYSGVAVAAGKRI